ncbi:unnamed protein product, partial [Rotaria sordida]
MQNIEEFRKSLRETHSVLGACSKRRYGAALGDFAGSGAEQKITVRSNFNPLACWMPSSITNSLGHVSFEVKLPDNLTRYRVWAVATNDKQYGLGEMSFTVQLPIMIRPSLPRFLNYGDIAH